MDAELRGRQQDRPADRHDWNSYENYVQVFEARVESHPFVDRGRPHTIAFEFYEFEGDLLLEMAGQIYCRKNVVLEVTKYFDTRRTRGGRLQVRCFSYRYNASIAGKHNLLRYDNGHDLDEYHRHRYDLETGELVAFDMLTRNEFPVLSEILDELARMLPDS
jgi:hypothetical protein